MSQCRYCLLVSLLIVSGTGTAVDIKINPDSFVESVENAVNITCAPGSSASNVHKILVIEIARSGETPIAMVNGSGVQLDDDHADKRFQVHGDISGNVSDSHLVLTIRNPIVHDSDTYICTMFYSDETGLVKDESEEGNLSVEEQDFSTIVTFVRELREKFSALEKNVLPEIQRNISILTRKANCLSAFSATTISSTSPSVGDVVQFPKVLTKVGQGYDESKSIFTAPMDGLYSFNLVIMIGCANCKYRIDLEVNNLVVGTLKVADEDFWDQSSISTVVKLAQGDTVKAVVQQAGRRLDNDESLLFNGFLIKCF